MMNIQGLGSTYQAQTQSSEPLTDDQKQTIDDILSNYDLENLSEEDHQSIRTALRDADIKPSSELRETLKEAGLSRPEGPPPGGRGGGKGPKGGGQVENPFSSTETQDTFLELIEALKSGDVEEDDFLSAMEELLNNEEDTTDTFNYIDIQI